MGVLKLVDVNKSYKNVKALQNFSYEFSNGIYGILGPNGAGKSTLMNIITHNLKKDSGEIVYNGEEIKTGCREYLGKIGYMPQQQAVYKNLSLNRFMYYMASLKALTKDEAREQIPRLLKAVKLWEDRAKLLGGFSGGMKQRALLAQALLGNPEIIVLDEPTAGLDPMQRIIVRELIEELGKDNIVIISTHIVSDIERLAKKIIVMKNGKIIQTRKLDNDNTESIEDMYMRLFGRNE